MDEESSQPDQRPAPLPVIPLHLEYEDPPTKTPIQPYNGPLAQVFYSLCFIVGRLIHILVFGTSAKRSNRR